MIQFLVNAIVRLVSLDRYVHRNVQKESMASSADQIVAVRMVEAVIHRRVSAFVQQVTQDQSVPIAVKASGMDCNVRKSVNASMGQIVIM